MGKKFKLAPCDIRPLVEGMGGCLASDKITVEGNPVRFMYRENPDNDVDSGWRFLSGLESDEYMENADNHGVYDVNTVANFDPTIVPHLDAEVGSTFEKLPESSEFALIES